jgi:cytochrome c-type biogenesis protein
MSVDPLQAGGTPRRRRIVGRSIAFVLGFSVVFVAMGASFSALSQLLVGCRDWVRQGRGVLLIVLGLYLAGGRGLGCGPSKFSCRQSRPAGWARGWSG